MNKKRNKQFLKEKEYLKLRNALDNNQYAQQALGYIELDEPVFIGWTAKLSLRDDIKNRADHWIFEFLINNLGTESFARKKEYFDWFNKKQPKHNYHINCDKPRIRSIDEDAYNMLTPQVKSWFTEDMLSSGHRWGKLFYCNVPNFYWEIIYEKTYKTHVQVIDEILKQEEAEIKGDLERKFYYINRYFGSVPKSYRKLLNRAQRNKAKQTLYNIAYKDKEVEFENDYRGAAWDYW
jgi:hypothetical protein